MKHMSPAAMLAASTALARPRALLGGVHADANDPATIIARLAKSFEDFKAENDLRLKSKADVVTDEKVDRINAEVGRLQTKVTEDLVKLGASVDDMAIKLAALQMNGAGNTIGDLPATDPAYVSAFKAHMRKGTVTAAMDKGTDSNGGYLAPIEWDRTITAKLKRISPIRANARVMSITIPGFKKLFSDRNIGSGWVGETATRPATTTPAIGSLDFVPGELYANPAISQQLLDDAAVDLGQWLADEVDTEFSRQEGIAFLSGNGTNKPYGILTYVTGGTNAARHPYGAIATVNTGNASAMTPDGFIDLVYNLPSEFAQNAKLYINRLALGGARKFKDVGGNYIWQPSYNLGEPSTLAGAPVIEMPDMPTVAAGNVVALYGDMESTYLVVDRIGISVLRDPFTDKPYVHFYTVKRVGGGVYNPEPMKALVVSA